MRNKLGYIVLVLLIAQLALILLSWLLTAAFPELPMRSMLSSEGIRWFFGSFVSNQLSPLLVYFIMTVMAAGACIRSRLYTALRAMLSNVRSSLTNSSNNRYRFHYRLSPMWLSWFFSQLSPTQFSWAWQDSSSPVPSPPVSSPHYRWLSSSCH